mmetsp:Transcript_8674/g.16120  ORF Transcript_8674/g.16120 Transcript_8674/m.16120 type:complete len:241 (-) Transcript_8674:166-888(-)
MPCSSHGNKLLQPSLRAKRLSSPTGQPRPPLICGVVISWALGRMEGTVRPSHPWYLCLRARECGMQSAHDVRHGLRVSVLRNVESIAELVLELAPPAPRLQIFCIQASIKVDNRSLTKATCIMHVDNCPGVYLPVIFNCHAWRVRESLSEDPQSNLRIPLYVCNLHGKLLQLAGRQDPGTVDDRSRVPIGRREQFWTILSLRPLLCPRSRRQRLGHEKRQTQSTRAPARHGSQKARRARQ